MLKTDAESTKNAIKHISYYVSATCTLSIRYRVINKFWPSKLKSLNA